MKLASVFVLLLASCASVSVGVTPVGDTKFPQVPEWASIPIYVSESLLDPKSEWVPVVQIRASGNAHADRSDVSAEIRKAAAPYGAHAVVQFSEERRHGYANLSGLDVPYSKLSGSYIGFRRK